MTNPQVRFGPRESRGWLLGMTTPQLLLGVAACAQPGGPPAATPTSSQMSLTPAPSTPRGSSAATATSGAQGGMGSMPGHDMSSMQGHNMGGMGGMGGMM